ncbi:hypothetical protein PHYC_02147 [Phycisphaerales bacterium]|nr:hypothetical protein PHYC_02147 [Phycisphaerales bacterium]
MVKIIRKNKQWFLAAFGTLLLITFLFSGSSSIFQSGRGSIVVATVGNEKILSADWDAASREYETLKDYARYTVQAEMGIENGAHWQLLVREAQKAGLVGEAGDGYDWLTNELPEAEAVGMIRVQYGQNPQILNLILSNPSFINPRIEEVRTRMVTERPALARRMNLMPEQFDLTIAKLRGVARLLNTYHRAARISDRQVVTDARRFLDSVQADVLLISADRLEPEAPTPTDSAVQSQYEQFRSVKPGEGEHGFGYVQPRRVKIEFLQLSKAAIGKAVVLDPIAVSKFYQQHRSEYPDEFAKERDKVEARLRDQKIEEVFSQFDSLYKTSIKNAARFLPADGAIRRLSAEWDAQRPTMERLAGEITPRVSEAAKVTVPLPSVTVRARQWTRLDQARTIPDLGEAVFNVGAQRATLADLINAMYEFSKEGSLGLQAKMPFDQYMTNAAGDRFYFCVLDWREESAPENLDEVREQVVRDLKLKWAYDKVAGESAGYKSAAISDGLEALGKRFAKPALSTLPAVPAIEVTTGVRISRMSVDQRTSQLDVPEVRDAVMDGVAALGFLTPPTPENVAARTFVFTLPKSLTVAVVQTTYPSPLTLEDLRTFNRNVYQILLREEVTAAEPKAEDPFSFENLKKRTNFKEIRESEDDGAPPAESKG